MATPVVGGTAALIQQYFSNKTYWSIYCNSTHIQCQLAHTSSIYTISGYMIKAIILHAGKCIFYTYVCCILTHYIIYNVFAWCIVYNLYTILYSIYTGTNHHMIMLYSICQVTRRSPVIIWDLGG